MNRQLTNPADRVEPYCEIAMIDSDIATMWLENNVRNRRLRPDKVAEMREAMLRGEWRLGSTLIAFDYDGALTNGQHTLTALSQCPGITISVVVAYNCDPEVYFVTDTGVKRTLADVLRSNGETNASALATALNWGYRLSLVEQGVIRVPVSSNGLIPTIPQLLEILEKNPGLRDSIVPAVRVCRHFSTPSGGLTWLHYQMSLIDSEKADEFFSLVLYGEYPPNHPFAGKTIGMKNPIRALRRTLTDNLSSKNRRMRSEHMMALVIKTANLWYAGKEAQVIKFLSSEDYPTLKWAKKKTVATKAPSPAYMIPSAVVLPNHSA